MPDINHSDREYNLFKDFEPVSRDQWESIVREVLNSEDINESLKWVSTEGFDVLPLYAKDTLDHLPHPETPSGKTSITRHRGKHSWLPAEFIAEPDPQRANLLIQKAAQNDVDLIHFACTLTSSDTEGGTRLKGIHIQNQQDFDLLLSGVDLSETGLMIESGLSSPALAAMLGNFTESAGTPSKNLSVFFLFDPWAAAAADGSLPDEEQIRQISRQLANQPVAHALAANGLFYHHCGATLIQELGIALATGSEFLANTKNPAQAAQSFWMQLSAGSLFFPEIAKFRSARMLWSRITEAYGLGMEAGKSLHIHAVTSPYNKTTVGEYHNLLRLTTESIAAVTGGADSMTILPYNSCRQTSDDRSTRLSRNIHHILKYESHLDEVSDPAGGSYYIEELTDIIAAKAWDQFRLIEGQGGMSKALQKGFLQRNVTESAEKRLRAVEQGKIRITGVTHYAEAGLVKAGGTGQETSEEGLKEAELKRSGIIFHAEHPERITELQEFYRNGGTLGDLAELLSVSGQQMIQRLNPTRLSRPFEDLAEDEVN